jgi:hypothetical protein
MKTTLSKPDGIRTGRESQGWAMAAGSDHTPVFGVSMWSSDLSVARTVGPVFLYCFMFK